MAIKSRIDALEKAAPRDSQFVLLFADGVRTEEQLLQAYLEENGLDPTGDYEPLVIEFVRPPASVYGRD